MEKQQKRHYYFGYYDGQGNFFIPIFEDEGVLSMAEIEGYPLRKVFDGKKIILFGAGQNLMIHIFYEKKLHEKYIML